MHSVDSTLYPCHTARRLALIVKTCSCDIAQVTYTAPDKVLTDPGIVTIQFDNVLFSVRSLTLTLTLTLNP